jgi:hypothetical protein
VSKGKVASSKSTADMHLSAPAKTATSVPPPPPGSPHRTSVSMTCVSSLSLISSPASANDSNMVSPDETMFSPRAMRVSPSPDRPSSKHLSRTVHGDGKKRAVRCLDEDLASTKQTAGPLQHSAALGSSLTSGCLDVETTQTTKTPNNKYGNLEAD